MRKKPAVRIAITNRGWCGYLGTRKVKEFLSDGDAARAWKRDIVSPVRDWGEAVNPVTGEAAPAEQMWIQSLMGPWVLTSNRSRFTDTCASETYWCS
jgi:hypothetical protein